MMKKASVFTVIFLCAVNLRADDAQAPEWKRSISAGYSRTSGNTETSQLSADGLINRNRKHIDEWTFKGSSFYSSSRGNMDAQKWAGMGRYAFSFGVEKKWYNFYKVEADHDRFANIDYRVLPSAGLGYWFSDTEDSKAMTELAGGIEHTTYRDAADDADEAVMIPRAFMEKALFEKSRLSQDLYMYPQIEDFSSYRIHSETTFVNPISDNLSLKLNIIDDYNSQPEGGSEKNDVRFISSLSYDF